MKKTLLELMVDVNIEWPEGAEYVAQDKSGFVYGYEEKPTKEKGRDHWGSRGLAMCDPITLPSLCKNWHQTIVTREQYEAAKADPVQVSDVFPEALGSPNTLDTDKQLLEEKLSAYQWANNRLAEVTVVVNNWTNRIKELEDEIAAELASFGWGGEVKPVGELNITDWRDLQVGDVIWWEGVNSSTIHGDEYEVISVENRNYTGSLSIELIPSWIDGDAKGWHFLRRP